jgi:hypothetical protein
MISFVKDESKQEGRRGESETICEQLNPSIFKDQGTTFAYLKARTTNLESVSNP